jgi:hypothetical protein
MPSQTHHNRNINCGLLLVVRTFTCLLIIPKEGPGHPSQSAVTLHLSTRLGRSTSVPEARNLSAARTCRAMKLRVIKGDLQYVLDPQIKMQMLISRRIGYSKSKDPSSCRRTSICRRRFSYLNTQPRNHYLYSPLIRKRF